MKYQKIAIWRAFLPKTNCFFHPPPFYPPARTRWAHPSHAYRRCGPAAQVSFPVPCIAKKTFPAPTRESEAGGEQPPDPPTTEICICSARHGDAASAATRNSSPEDGRQRSVARRAGGTCQHLKMGDSRASRGGPAARVCFSISFELV
jgi:hypothetical protein